VVVETVDQYGCLLMSKYTRDRLPCAPACNG
jgi:hypothetical protein